MKLFEVGKVGCFLDAVTHALETRRGEDVKVLSLTLRVSPFDVKLAGAMPDGVKPTLFTLNTGDPKPSLRRVDFALGMERQLLTVFASTDTRDATIALDQVKIHGTYARVQKNRNGFVFVFKATFGPVGREELEFVQAWLLTQKFLTFEQAEPSMFDDDEDDEDEADRLPNQPTPMFDDPRDVPVNMEVARPISKRHPTRAAAAKAHLKDRGTR